MNIARPSTVVADEYQARRDAVARLLRISEAILLAAREGHWTQVSEREPERQRLVWAFFEQPLNEIEASRFAPELHRVLEISQELTRLADVERGALVDANRQLARGQRAQRAYAGQALDTPR